jgi:hypothetical protein
MQNLSLRQAVHKAASHVDPESRRLARFLDTLTRRNVSLAEYEADPDAYWHPARPAKEDRRDRRGHRGFTRR